MNRKLHQLFQPSLQLYFVCLVGFALASALFSLPLAALELDDMVKCTLKIYKATAPEDLTTGLPTGGGG